MSDAYWCAIMVSANHIRFTYVYELRFGNTVSGVIISVATYPLIITTTSQGTCKMPSDKRLLMIIHYLIGESHYNPIYAVEHIVT